MTNQEFSDTFDTLINSYALEVPFGKETGDLAFNEYEKSLFLTKAQEELVLSVYTGKNQFLDSFEKTEEIRRYLNPLVKSARLYADNNNGYITVSINSKVFKLPKDLWFIVYEEVDFEGFDCKTNNNVQVVPVTHDEYHRVKNNPFRGPSDIRVIRLDIGNNNVELVSNNNIKYYTIRYISKLKPIVLIDLGDEISIDGISNKTECEMPSFIHKTIVKYAVNMAVRSRVLNTKK